MSESPEQVTELARAFAASAPKMAGAEQIALSLYRLLAAGSPVSIDRLAEAAGTGTDEAARILSAWPGVYFDDRDAIIGFWGLAIEPMPHRLIVDDRTLYTWCAWDGLFMPEILGVAANFVTQCPVSRVEISVDLDRHGGFEARTPDAVMSFLRPEKGMFDGDIIGQFCHYVYLFNDRQTAQPWLDSNPDAILLDLPQAVELSRLKNELQFGRLLRDDHPRQVSGM